MRKHGILMVLLAGLFLVGFSACKKTEKEGKLHPLVGTWNIYAGGVDENENGTLDPDEKEDAPADLTLTLTFKADQSGTRVENDGSGETSTDPFTWSTNAENTQLTIADAGDTVDIDIINLTSSELELFNDGIYLFFKKQ